jgi:diguanylate cyclase
MFRDLFHGSSAIMYLIDPVALTLVDVNQAAASFYGYPREAMLGMELHRLTVHTREELVAIIDAVRADASTTVIDENQKLADGTVRLVEIHSTPMHIASREFDLAIVQDVTERRMALEQLERLASTDELTGTLNRRRFLELVRAIIANPAPGEVPMAMLMLDLDHFKAVNDALGHAGGDDALDRFCEATRSRLRSGDLFARLGGEEFAVVLPRTDVAGARQVAEAIRRAVEGSGVTVSIGVAEWEPGMTVDQLYARADKLLYEAKQAGRNRVVG